MLADHLDTVGLIVGTSGSLLWAQNGKYMRYCAVFWAASSVLWLAFAMHKGLTTLCLSNCVNLAIHAYGARTWLAARTKSLSNCRISLSNVDLGRSVARLLPRIGYRIGLPTWRRRRP